MYSTKINRILVKSLILLSSCNGLTKEENGKSYKISGIIAENINAKYIFLLDKNLNKVDSTKIIDYKFKLEGKLRNPNIYNLKLNNQLFSFILENASYKTIINNCQGIILGGKLNTKFSNYLSKKINFDKNKASLLDLFSKRTIGLQTYLHKIDSIKKIEKETITNLIMKNSENLVSCAIIKNSSFTSDEAIQIKNKIAENGKSDHLIRKLNLLINDLKITEASQEISKRKPTPMFSGTNLAGKQTHLEQLIEGKKLFLIDFWASWCQNCRILSPKIIELYEKYNKLGFDILTVSEDRSVDDWKNGIMVDKIDKWHHIYDDFNRISTMFNVGALPHMVLLDENGKIIKNKISIESLENYLNELSKNNKYD